jgi:SOS-response transcriptional repressor LexA
MNLKEAVGNRISESRKILGITIKELAARIDSLSAQRISNYEQGIRSPGPQEAKLLGQQLNVSASYLLHLTDNPQGEFLNSCGSAPRQIPVLSMQDAALAKESMQEGGNFNFERIITIDGFNSAKNKKDLFAVVVEDQSMQPEFDKGDVIVIDSENPPCPGDFVLAYLTMKKQTVLRKYRETENCLFQLLASNELWATVNVKQPDDAVIIGVVVEHRRFF